MYLHACRVDFNTQASQSSLSSDQRQEVQQLRTTVKDMFTSATGMFTSKWFIMLLFIPRSLFPLLRVSTDDMTRSSTIVHVCHTPTMVVCQTG